ncbi:hypothetical protein EC991_011007 [Linnemannia zychae]|nr:hypothetical protein EC991_011007 [Linnemannia zychae]
MANDRTQSAQIKKNSRAEEWLKNAVKDKHVRMIPFSEISKVKYNVAKGGSGTIHLGAWRNMHIAIKEQHNTNDLIKELKMHKQVHDSNYIVKFFGITKHPLTHDTCIVMQFAENGCLQDFLETQNVSITWLTKYRLAWEIASGLDFIHRENIFHTDLHSRNILIDTGGKALITDFGLSKSVNKTIYTTKAGLFGVVPYVAPERMQNPTYTYNAKCDIYSLGVILWELSSCVIPFEAQLQDVMLAVNIIAGVREKTVPGTAVEYEMLYRRCWDGLPQNRPNMEIVLSELVELLAAEQINPRAAAPRPISPRPPRPLSSESMLAPSTPFPYDNDATVQSSPENTTHMRPASPPSQRPAGNRQSIAQGLAPKGQGIPSVPIRDRSGVRVSFIDNQPAKDSKANGAANVDNSNQQVNGAKAIAPNGRVQPMTVPDSPTVSSPPPEEVPQTKASVGDSDASKAPTGPQLLPPLPSFKALALTTPPKDISIPPVPPMETINSVLPETASLALASGLSMVSVVSKLNLGSIRTISTISPPPPGAPPPPPAAAGHSNSPRVISPPSNRPKVISPPKIRNNQAPPPGRASKTISPPAGSQGRLVPPPPPGTPPIKPSGSPSLGPSPKPPAGMPPSPVLNGSSSTAAKIQADAPRNPVSPIVYVPATTYKGKSETKVDAEPSLALPSETRPPPRQVAMGFPVVAPLDPHVFPKRSPASEQAPSNTPSIYKTSSQIDVKPSNSPQALRPSSPEATRKEADPRTSHAIDANKIGSSMENGAASQAQRTVNHNPPPSSSGSNPPPRASPGFFPVVDTFRAGLSKARDQKNQGNRSPDMVPKEQEGPGSSRSGPEEHAVDGRTDPRDMRVAQKDASPPASQGPASKPRVQFDNFYSLADPYKELSQDEPSDFFTAVTQGDLETIERLLKAHPYLLHESIGFWPHPTPILLAARSRHAIETMKVLIKHGAALDRGDHNGTTVLHFVCEQYPNPTEAVIFLTKAGADCNSRDSKKRTPLMVLLQNSHIASTKVLVETMRVLFKLGAQTKVVDHQQQRTPLHYAIQHCKEPAPAIELLLKKGAEVNAMDSRKSTPLHMVLEKMDNEEIVQMLLLYGADPSLRNGNKRNALCVAAENLRVMSAWFLLENDLLSSAPDTIKKANELCSKADGPDKNSKPLFKNLLSDWQGKEGKIRRIQLAQDCILRVQRTPDMKTIDQTQVALEFLESAGASIYMNEQDNLSNGGGAGYAPSSPSGAGGSPSILRLGNIRHGNNHNNNNHSNNNNGHLNNGMGTANGSSHNPSLNNGSSNGGSPTSHHPSNLNNNNIKELRLAEGVEPLKQTMLPVKSVQQLEKEREAMRHHGLFGKSR